MPRRTRRLVPAAVLAAALVPASVAATPAAADHRPPTSSGTSFQRLATFPVYRHSTDPATETVAEITAATPDGRTLLSTDSAGERILVTDITDPARPAVAGSLAVGGEPTSVAVHRAYALVVVDTSDSFTAPSGELLVVRLGDRSVVRRIDLGGQPDAIALSPAGARGGTYAAIAIENQRDEEVADGALPQLPGGSLVTVPLTGDPASWSPTRVDLRPALAGRPGIVAPEDPEPEYVTINRRNQVAVTLQENNGIAVVDLPTGRVVSAFTAGTVDLTGVDTVEDGRINPTGSLADVPREPDGVAWVDDTRLATANEGDLAGGSRGWSVFDARSGRVLWDAGSSLERLAVSVGLYPESRSENKGTEPENITVAEVDGRRYAFVGAERGNVVAVYDLTRPTAPRFRQVLPVTNGPEGLLAIPGRDLLVVSSEVDVPEDDVRATIAVFRLGRGAPEFPTIAALPRDGQPIGWGALSGLAADRHRDDRPGTDRLWAVGDSYYTPTQLFSVQTVRARGLGTRALIRSARTVTEGGRPLGVDAEGVATRPGGGFWLAAEGETGAGNELLQLDDRAAVQRRVPLPAAVAAGLGSNGLEGIAVTGSGRTERVFVALQRPLSTDPAGVARVGRYDVATGTWTWYGYRLDTGSGVGLSELVALGGTRFAVVERDDRAGTFARVKRLYIVDVARTTGTGDLPVLTKTLARDLLPDLRATNGWVQEKVEGLAVGGDGRVYLVTDNDGVEDATGETVFADLGPARRLFGR